MNRSTRLLALALSLATAAPPMTALAFAPALPTLVANADIKTFFGRTDASSRLFYRAGATEQEVPTIPEIRTIADAPCVDDATHHSILHNPLHTPVLVDCYVSKCGPCKLIERSLDAVLPRYTNDLLFCKWDADRKDESERFVQLLRDHDMTFRKLPTLILFVEGMPVAMRSGMASAGQIERFLEDHLPGSNGMDGECVDEVNLEGEKFLCEE